MRGVEHDSPLEALAWLASTRAEVYFDLLEIPQSSALIHSGWMELAREHLHEPCIRTTYVYLDSLKPTTG